MARLSWNEIRVRAATFAMEWQDAAYEKGEAQSFYNDFFNVFDVKRRSVSRYEEHVKKLDNRSGYIDLFWPGVLLVEHKSAGKDLAAAYDQAGEYFDAIPERERPRYILVSDFQNFELRDLTERRTATFGLADLPDHVDKFGFVVGVSRRMFRDQDPVNIAAAELVGRLHDALRETRYSGHDLERFLVRVTFCLFADDTGVFERNIFLNLITERTSEDGANTGQWLGQLFEVLDTPEADRSSVLDEDLDRFPYVNGGLFEGQVRVTSFNANMRNLLLEACWFNWSNISPATFGALFQSVIDPDKRRADGAHYTTEANIMKVIGPLFMDGLQEEFQRLRSRRDSRRAVELKRFQQRLGTLSFFDPACGCGNFLVIAYRELRRLEIEVLREIRAATGQSGQQALDVQLMSHVDVDQFYGIELGEFPARIAETALWMMDHIMNTQLSLEFGQTYTRIPLETSPRIICGDALETDWAAVLPPDQCSYVFGNPPFSGSKIQKSHRRGQVKQLFGGGRGTLDYVTAWFAKAGEYLQGNRSVRIGFVATNSITQGEQPGQLWPVLFDRYSLEISFAHRTFAWGSDARGKAHVHVVIIGLDHSDHAPKQKRLFDYPDINGQPDESSTTAISPYLVDAAHMDDPHVTVRKEYNPINGMSRLRVGSKPIDGGIYILNANQRAAFLDSEPEAEPFLRPYIGGREYLHNVERWILVLHDAAPDQLARLPQVKERISRVRSYRLARKSAPTRKLADTPTRYHVNVLPTGPYLVVPESSSERREYIPIGWLEPPTIPSNLVKVLTDASLADFALLTSTMHMEWMRRIGGRIKSDYRYSVGVVYNTFPTPPGYHTKDTQAKLEPVAQAVVDARAVWPHSTLANLYDPDLMPPNLRRAHQSLDRTVDRLYSRTRFTTQSQRIQHLLTLYRNAQCRDVPTGRSPS